MVIIRFEVWFVENLDVQMMFFEHPQLTINGHVYGKPQCEHHWIWRCPKIGIPLVIIHL